MEGREAAAQSMNLSELTLDALALELKSKRTGVHNAREAERWYRREVPSE